MRYGRVQSAASGRVAPAALSTIPGTEEVPMTMTSTANAWEASVEASGSSMGNALGLVNAAWAIAQAEEKGSGAG